MENQQSIFALSVSKFFLLYLVMMTCLLMIMGIAFFEKDIAKMINGDSSPNTEQTSIKVVRNSSI